MIMRIIIGLLWAVAFVSVARAQDAVIPKPTGECMLAEGQSTALDGSCGTWTAKLKSAKSGATKGKKNELTVTTVIDLSHLRPSPRSEQTPASSVAVYFCITAAHDAHKADKLIIAVMGDKDKSADYCKVRKLLGVECVKQSSKQDLRDCGKVKNHPRLKGGGVLWCVDRKDEKEAKQCRYLQMRFGEMLSVWITKSKDDSLYAEERSASGTWTLVR